MSDSIPSVSRQIWMSAYPIGSMVLLYIYIYGNIYHQYTPNVSIYTSTMDPMGIGHISHVSHVSFRIVHCFESFHRKQSQLSLVPLSCGLNRLWKHKLTNHIMPYLRIPSYLMPYLIGISHVWWLRSLVIFIHILSSDLDRIMGKLAGKLCFFFSWR